MADLSPIDRILGNFYNKEDCRVSWWMDIKRHIQDGDVFLAMEKLKYHNGDDDYTEQLEAVLDEIIWNVGHKID